MTDLSRRQAMLMTLSVPLIPLVSGCRASLPAWSAPGSSQEALELLHTSAVAHGVSAYLELNDVNVSYVGHWRWLVGKLQPDLVDPSFRGGSEERLMPRLGIVAQSHSGPKGHKQVVRVSGLERTATTNVWFNGQQTQNRVQIDASALVAEAYALFLFGPMLLAANQAPHREIQAQLAPAVRFKQEHSKAALLCDVINLKVRPGFGNSDTDDLALYIERETRLMHRVRMTLNGLESTRGALVDIDTSKHRQLHGIMWPTVFHERLLRPAPLDVHHWRLSGLDVNRGETQTEISGARFEGKAAEEADMLLSAG